MPMAGPPTTPFLAQTDMVPCKQPSIKNASKPRLPTEIILIILANLDAQTLLSAARTCRQWYALAKRYRQYLWRHLAWHDFSFTSARSLWKLEFFNDRDLSSCFPRPPPLPSSEQSRRGSHPRTQSGSMRGHAQSHSSFASSSSPCKGLEVDLAPGFSLNESQVMAAESKEKRHFSIESRETSRTRLRSDDKSDGAHRIDRASRCESDSDVHLDQTKPGSRDTIRDDMDDLDLLGPQEQDWKALYQLTSNWYRGRAKGYCPIMLPSLTTLASATQSIAQGSLVTSSTSAPSTSTSSASARELSTSSATTTAVAKTVSASTSAQAAIRRILRMRKPQTVVGLQHEGSALTALSLVAHPLAASTGDTQEEHNNIEPRSKRGRNQGFRDGIALARSNPHYRERRPSTQTQHTNHHQHDHNTHLQHHHPSHHQQNHQQHHQHNSTLNTAPPRQKPNIMVQDPLQHDKIQFAMRVPSPPPQLLPTDQTGANGHPNGSAQPATQSAQPTLALPTLSPIQVSPPLGQMSDDPADDILCHFSSVLHSFIVTGHMDGSVRLWNLSIKEAGQQCIRLWHTGSRQRVLCVGMNSKVVVCGNVDSTLCVWDIHPAPGTSSSTHGTIHTASYLASTMPPGIQDWVSGIEHICVGDSLVACSTEFPGSVLVFSLATGSLVYEIPGLHQPSKMCMTDFFLLTGGRGAGRGGQARAQAMAQGQGPHHGLGQDADRLRNGQQSQNLEVDEYMSCCVNVWDLRTGQRLYSLIPRLSMHHFQHPISISSMIHGHRDESVLKSKRTEKKRVIRTSSYLPDICSGSRAATPFNSASATSNWTTRIDMLSNTSIAVPSPIAGSDGGNYARSRSTNNSPFLGQNAQHGMSSLSDSSASSSSSLSSLSESTSVSTPSEETSQTRRTLRSLPASPQSPISAPLTLVDIAVTPDHSTLVVTLSERSGEGREGVYAWDFSGTRLDGYHEQGQESGSTIIVDKSDFRFGTDDESDDGGDRWDEGDERDLDLLYGSRACAREGSGANHCGSDQDHHDSFGEEDEEQEDEEAVDMASFNNNMIMQQVDSTAFSALHQARVTGKVWIGWKLGDRDFQILRHRYVRRLLAQKRERQLRRERRMKGNEEGNATLVPGIEKLSI
ncbi:hypothetical protein BGZ59_003141, partial [Podila verticillata]